MHAAAVSHDGLVERVEEQVHQQGLPDADVAVKVHPARRFGDDGRGRKSRECVSRDAEGGVRLGDVRVRAVVVAGALASILDVAFERRDVRLERASASDVRVELDEEPGEGRAVRAKTRAKVAERVHHRRLRRVGTQAAATDEVVVARPHGANHVGTPDDVGGPCCRADRRRDVTTTRDAADPRTNAKTRERARRASRHRERPRATV